MNLSTQAKHFQPGDRVCRIHDPSGQWATIERVFADSAGQPQVRLDQKLDGWHIWQPSRLRRYARLNPTHPQGRVHVAPWA